MHGDLQHLVCAGHETRCIHELSYVAGGYLSDSPHFELYLPLRQLSTKMWIHRCLRTSSALEGYHQHYDGACSSCGKNTGLRYFNAVTNAFDWRWVVRALIVSGLLPKWLHHFNLQLVDLAYDLAEELYGSGGGARVFPGWRRTKLMESPVIRQGVHYGLAAQKRALGNQNRSTVVQNTSDAAWVSNKLGSPIQLRKSTTASDVAAMLDSNCDLEDAASISKVAFGCGLHLPPQAAKEFGNNVVQGERARQLLDAAGHRALQQKL